MRLRLEVEINHHQSHCSAQIILKAILGLAHQRSSLCSLLAVLVRVDLLLQLTILLLDSLQFSLQLVQLFHLLAVTNKRLH